MQFCAYFSKQIYLLKFSIVERMILITIHIITCFICTCDFTLKRSTCMTKDIPQKRVVLGLVVKERERVSKVYDFGLKFSQEVNQQNFGHLKLATQ